MVETPLPNLDPERVFKDPDGWAKDFENHLRTGLAIFEEGCRRWGYDRTIGVERAVQGLVMLEAVAKFDDRERKIVFCKAAYDQEDLFTKELIKVHQAGAAGLAKENGKNHDGRYN